MLMMIWQKSDLKRGQRIGTPRFLPLRHGADDDLVEEWFGKRAEHWYGKTLFGQSTHLCAKQPKVSFIDAEMMECFACVCVQYAVEAPERVKKKKKPSGWFSSWFSSSDDEEDIEVETESKGRGIFLHGLCFLHVWHMLVLSDLCYTVWLSDAQMSEREGEKLGHVGRKRSTQCKWMLPFIYFWCVLR